MAKKHASRTRPAADFLKTRRTVPLSVVKTKARQHADFLTMSAQELKTVVAQIVHGTPEAKTVKKVLEYRANEKRAAKKRTEASKTATATATVGVADEGATIRRLQGQLEKAQQEVEEKRQRIEYLAAELAKVRHTAANAKHLLQQVRSLVSEDAVDAKAPDWEDNLEKYLKQYDGQKAGAVTAYRPNTARSYENWLKPWVQWLRLNGSVPTAMLIKKYLDEHPHFSKNPHNYNRVGKQIVAFTNSYTNNRVHLVKAKVMNQPAKQHARMDRATYHKIEEYLRKFLVGEAGRKLEEGGKAVFARYLAVYFALTTGARPNEAAYVVYNKALNPLAADRLLPPVWGEFDWEATMPGDSTKTRQDYGWLIKKKRNWFVEMVRRADCSTIGSLGVFQNSLGAAFHDIRQKAGVGECAGTHGSRVNLRSARCYRATKWVQLSAEYRAMKWDDDIPPNPLQHTTPHLTRTTYAEPGADDYNQAVSRCWKKYAEAETLFKRFRRANVAPTTAGMPTTATTVGATTTRARAAAAATRSRAIRKNRR